MNVQPYDDAFFDDQAKGSLVAARTVLPILFEQFQPRSVVDIGCGVGTWLKAASELGVPEILGVDGSYVNPSRLMINGHDFLAQDLSQPIRLDRRFDLAMSLEVAEHLPTNRSGSIVEDLVKLSDVVLFSAAVPYQGGTNHINEQWLEFWALHFRRFEYVPCDCLRPRIWNNPLVPDWYSQNLMVFCRDNIAARFGGATSRQLPLSLTHPLIFLVNVARYRPMAEMALYTEFDDYKTLVAAYRDGADSVPPLQIVDATHEGQNLFPQARTTIIDPSTASAAHIMDQQAAISQLTSDLNDRDQQLEAMINSASWRWTAPVRTLAGWLLKKFQGVSG